MGGWVSGPAAHPQALTRAGHGWGLVREGPWPGGSAHSEQDHSSTPPHVGGPGGPCLCPSCYLLPTSPLRCGLLHLPLPTVDLPRRPHAGERVWHERRGPNSSCPCGRGPASSRGPLTCPQPCHDRGRRGGGLYTPALPGPPGAQLCQRAPGSPSKASRGQKKGLITPGPPPPRLLVTTTPLPWPLATPSPLLFPWTDRAGVAGGPHGRGPVCGMGAGAGQGPSFVEAPSVCLFLCVSSHRAPPA